MTPYFTKSEALAAVTQSGYALKNLPPIFQNDREVVMTAVAQTGFALKYASLRLQDDREVVLTAVSKAGYGLEYASSRLKNDRSIVLAAVTNSWDYVLRFASPALQNDRNIVLVAMTKNGKALHCVPSSLQNDLEIVLAAVDNAGDDILRFASMKVWLAVTQYQKKHPCNNQSALVSLISQHRAHKAYTAGAIDGIFLSIKNNESITDNKDRPLPNLSKDITGYVGSFFKRNEAGNLARVNKTVAYNAQARYYAEAGHGVTCK